MERDMKSPITQLKHGKQQITQIVHRTTRTYKTMLIKRDILVLDPYKLLWWFGSLIKALHHHHNFRPASDNVGLSKTSEAIIGESIGKAIVVGCIGGGIS